ncbi:MAG: large conductance mechanosensitive channel protein MscL [Candidatus Dojkabacteria bacterium]|jgi:large conductance mechanosensitive channel
MKKKRKTIKEKIEGFAERFKDFAFKGSVIDIAIGMIIGSAITSVVESLIKDIINPPLAKLLSGIDFSHRYFVLGQNHYESLEAAQEAGEIVFTYGNFIDALISFLITSFTLFIIISWISKLSKKHKKDEQEKHENTTKKCPFCKSSIDKDAKKCPFCTSEIKE